MLMTTERIQTTRSSSQSKLFWILNAALIVLMLMWIRSYFRSDWLGYTHRGNTLTRNVSIQSMNGELCCDRSISPNDPADKIAFRCGSVVVTDRSFVFRWSHAGFFAFGPVQMYSGVATSPVFYQAGIPYWSVVLPLGLFCGYRWMKHRAQRRSDPRIICRSCGYDLRASRDRCPECGTLIPSDPALAKG